jgi:tRNA dimethylallyltransferase
LGELFKPKIIFVVGPTATGKSDLAVLLAEKFQAEIINADSIQFYNQISVGTAKPSADLLKRVTHHLLSFVDPPQSLSAGDFSRCAHQILEQRLAAGVKNFIIVGGSGFYIQALERGMYPLAQIDEKIRAQVREDFVKLGAEKLWQELVTLDPEYSKKISTHDSYRVMRGLEILRSGQKSMLQAQQEFQSQESQLHKDFSIQKIALDLNRDHLRERVRRRTEQMLANHWLEEVQSLRDRGLADWAPMKSVGYFEISEFLNGNLKPFDLQEKIVTSTLQLAKKQRTWFKRDRETQWILLEQADPERFLSEALRLLSPN